MAPAVALAVLGRPGLSTPPATRHAETAPTAGLVEASFIDAAPATTTAPASFIDAAPSSTRPRPPSPRPHKTTTARELSCGH